MRGGVQASSRHEEFSEENFNYWLVTNPEGILLIMPTHANSYDGNQPVGFLNKVKTFL